MPDLILESLRDRKILILGFGREGTSSYAFLQHYLPSAFIAVADANSTISPKSFQAVKQWHLGKDYLKAIPQYDIVLQSPGVCLKDLPPEILSNKITSQTDLFLKAFGSKCIGITGTKGKSTTSSLIYHLLKENNKEVLFGGNIGLPLFDLIPQISSLSTIVMELSCHQLEFAQHSPHIALLLNLFEEHLDHYINYFTYQRAKFNIARYQKPEDTFIYPAQNQLIENLIKQYPPVSNKQVFSAEQLPEWLKDERFPLTGAHNMTNAMAALLAVKNAFPSISQENLKSAMFSFRGLPHRLEKIGCYNGVTYYNDSISTIPQATIAAVNALKNVDTLLLGGMDRGIDYSPLKELFEDSSISNFLFTGAAGKRMLSMAKPNSGKHFEFFEKFAEMVEAAKKCTRKGMVCLLSPAAPSYDAFKNFEERGSVFKNLVEI